MRQKEWIRTVRARLHNMAPDSGTLEPRDIVEVVAEFAPERRAAFQNVLSGTARFFEIRYFSNFAGFLSHEAYENLIRHNDMSLILPERTDVRFFGRGGGKGGSTLNAYRSVRINDEALFEKIYDSASLDKRRALLFYRIVGKYLADRSIPFADLSCLSEGEKISVFYTGLMKSALKKCPREELIKQLRHISEFSFSSAEELNSEPAVFENPDVWDFTRHNRYKSGMQYAKGALPEDDYRTLKALEDRLKSMPRLFAHGDISTSNITGHGEIIDIDIWGMYPPFYDIAFVLGAQGILARFDSAQDYVDYVSTAFIKPRDRADVLSLLFFSFVFQIGRDPEGFDMRLLSELVALARAEI